MKVSNLPIGWSVFLGALVSLMAVSAVAGESLELLVSPRGGMLKLGLVSLLAATAVGAMIASMSHSLAGASADSVELQGLPNAAEDLRRALMSGEFELFYQPRMAVDGGVRGAEASIRWNHPARGVLELPDFIPVAEESGLIVAIVACALEDAACQIALWNRLGLEGLIVAVTLPALQFRRRDIERQLRRVLAATAIAPEQLQLRLAESPPVEDVEAVLDEIARVRALGVAVMVGELEAGEARDERPGRPMPAVEFSAWLAARLWPV